MIAPAQKPIHADSQFSLFRSISNEAMLVLHRARVRASEGQANVALLEEVLVRLAADSSSCQRFLSLTFFRLTHAGLPVRPSTTVLSHRVREIAAGMRRAAFSAQPARPTWRDLSAYPTWPTARCPSRTDGQQFAAAQGRRAEAYLYPARRSAPVPSRPNCDPDRARQIPTLSIEASACR